MSQAYEGVKAFARDHPEWVHLIRACLETSSQTPVFAGSWVFQHMGGLDNFSRAWFPGLRMLAKYGILQRDHGSRGGHRAYWRIDDPVGVYAAARELGLWGGRS